VVPQVRRLAERPLVGQHPRRAGQVLGQPEHALTVLVGQHLADRRLGPRRLAADGGADRAEPDEPQDLALDVQVGEPLAQHRVVGAAP
jgi:hypothetical protein